MREPSQADGEAKPKLPDVNEEESELQAIAHKQRNFLRASPFHLAMPVKGEVVLNWNPDQPAKAASSNAALTAVLTLKPNCFPEELYTSKEQRAANQQAQRAHWKKSGQGEGDLFDRLGQMEHARDGQGEPVAKRQRVLLGEETADHAGGDMRTRDVEGNEEDEQEVELDDEEEDEVAPEEDDYAMGEHFDDDEGYEVDDDAGGNDGEYY